MNFASLVREDNGTGTTNSAEETIIAYSELRGRELHKDSPEMLRVADPESSSLFLSWVFTTPKVGITQGNNKS